MKVAISLLVAVCFLTPARADSLADTLKTCNAEASSVGMTGEQRKSYVADCIKSAHPAPAVTPGKTGDVIKPMPGVAEKAKKAVTADLKDPYSAVVEIKAIVGPLVCGTLNAKNSYGAYTGKQRFLYNGNTDAVINITEELQDAILRPIGEQQMKDCDDWEREAAANGGKIRTRVVEQ